MKIDWIPEPLLEFGRRAKQEDIRFGIMNYGPFDLDRREDPWLIRLGVVGTDQTIEGVLRWLERCENGVEAKESKQPNLFPRFPGFRDESSFGAHLSCDSTCQRSILPEQIKAALASGDESSAVEQLVELFLQQIAYLADEKTVDVIICSIPEDVLGVGEAFEAQSTPEDDPTQELDEESQRGRPRLDFHHMLKAKAMGYRKPIQLVLPTTYGVKPKPKKQDGSEKRRTLQDEATRAWNFYTALYYKAGGTPWRLARDSSRLTSCYVGVSFFRTLDEASVHTSIAQVFDELGDGIVIRGAEAKVTKQDRQPHLAADDAYDLLVTCLKRYWDEHKTSPARLVLHKSSKFTKGEIDGFGRALADERIARHDFLNIRRSFTRLFRPGRYPPLRGTFWTLDDSTHILYTRGSVCFYATYPGMYVPSTLEFHLADTSSTPRSLAEELLALTKMNWDSTQFDHLYPITLEAARQVGKIVKYVGPNDPLSPRYSFYM